MSTEQFIPTRPPSWSEDPFTARARTIWSSGDFVQIAHRFVAGAEAFVSRLALQPGERVLDAACGTGNVAIAAARSGARVKGIDLAPILIAEARLEALAARCAVVFETGSIEALPYEDAYFDTTLSMLGVMFSHRPARATDELLRVTRAGGRIALASWTPAGLFGKLERLHASLAASPADAPSPLDWGREDVVRERLGDRVTHLQCTNRSHKLRFPFPPSATAELFATCYGPTVMALRTTDPASASRFRAELTDLFQLHNLATDRITVVTSDYLDVQARVA